VNKLSLFSAVIFDMDGLILDSERPMIAALKRAVASFGRTLPDADAHRFVGRSSTACSRLIAELFGQDFPVTDVFALSYDYYDQIMRTEGIPLKPGVLELLTFLEQQNIPRAVATSTGHSRACEQLKKLEILQKFEFVMGGNQVSRGKPAPDIYRETALNLGLKPELCLALEDSAVGIQAACAAGCYAIWVPDMAPPPAELRHLARHIYNSLFDVLEMLNGNQNR